MRDLGLVGVISPQLSNLTYLQALDLSNNRLQGEIPHDLGSCIALRAINLSVNSLSGQIPWSIGNLPKLTVLNVRDNKISGNVPATLGNLTAPTMLSIADNYINGRIPPWIGNMTNLTDLNIAGNVFHGYVPSNIAGLTDLLALSLLGNKLQGVFPPVLFNITSLEIMYISLNMLSGSLPMDIGSKLPNLVVLSAIYNQFEGPILDSLSNISKLEYLQLHGNKFQGRIPPNIGSSGTITRLNLGNNILEAKTPNDWDFLTSLTNCSELVILDIELNSLSGFIPNTLVNLSQELIWIGLGGNQIFGTIPAGIGRFRKLTVLELAGNFFTGNIPLDIGQLSSLHRLLLYGNNLSGEIPPSVGNLTQLNELLLFQNNLDNKIPETLGNLSSLNSMDLSYNMLSGKIPEVLMRMPSLTKQLNLSNNLLGGPISPQIQELVNLGAIDLSGNKLSGQIPYTLGSCVELQFLFLQMNLLQGKIPSELSTLRGLEGLDLSNNNLSGPIPDFLGNFQATVAVKVLDLRHKGATQGVFAECNALRRIQHRKLVKVVTVCDSLDHNGNEFKAIVLEFISNGSLDTWLKAGNKVGTLSLIQRLNIIMDVAQALEYLHNHIEPPIVHCDIKPSNILLDEDMVAHVSDFGLAKIMNVDASRQSLGESISNGVRGSIGYLAPEHGMGAEISPRGDVYNYGVLVLQMLTGKEPTDAIFDGTTSLPKYVEMAYPDKLSPIVDAAVIANSGGGEETINMFIAPVAKIGLACCRDNASQRMDFGDIVKELVPLNKLCQDYFLTQGASGGNSSDIGITL
uniref:non-specific serine/threonine protein kinase n=1 Tax=Oryza meridionalis TaxID=40149 RepID=A0A0E0EWR5_9ORYZ